MNQMGSLIVAQGLKKVYGRDGSVVALDNVSFQIQRGEFLAIRGPSGSGKTTLLNMIGTLDTPTHGELYIDQISTKDLKGNLLANFRRQKIGFIFQLFHLLPMLTVLENVMLPLLPYRRELKFNLEHRARTLLEKVGLPHRLNNLPGQLSGGECQRAAIARALINQPTIVLADEPTGNLDTKNGQEIVHLLEQLNQEMNATIIIVTHDPGIASRARRSFILQDGILMV